MAGPIQPVQNILAKLTTLQVINQDNQSVALHSRLFNDQYKKFEEGKCEVFPLPSAFVEIAEPGSFVQIGNGYNTSDMVFRIHIGHWFTDAGDGTFNQDFGIFVLRDKIVTLLSGYKPAACGPLVMTSESPDYNHTMLNVYVVEFTAHFIDSKGSPDDPDSRKYIYSVPPTNLDLEVTGSIGGGDYTNPTGGFRIPKKQIKI